MYYVNALITTVFKAYSFNDMTGSLNLIDDKSPNDIMPIALLTEWMDWLFTAIPNQMELVPLYYRTA
jgi:hypothetical protein